MLADALVAGEGGRIGLAHRPQDVDLKLGLALQPTLKSLHEFRVGEGEDACAQGRAASTTSAGAATTTPGLHAILGRAFGRGPSEDGRFPRDQRQHRRGRRSVGVELVTAALGIEGYRWVEIVHGGGYQQQLVTGPRLPVGLDREIQLGRYGPLGQSGE